MIVDTHVQSFIHSLQKEDPQELIELQKFAREHHVPIIRRETGELLRFLIGMNRPCSILEIGTAIGYSSIVMAKELKQVHRTKDTLRIDTIERNENRYQQAVANVKRLACEDVISIHFGDALQVLESLQGSYDMIFMDAAKGQYERFFQLCNDKLKTGGLLVCDNILQEGTVAQSRYAVTRRDHTVHKRMREFLYMLKQDSRYRTVILPVGDGVALAYKEKP